MVFAGEAGGLGHMVHRMTSLTAFFCLAAIAASSASSQPDRPEAGDEACASRESRLEAEGEDACALQVPRPSAVAALEELVKDSYIVTKIWQAPPKPPKRQMFTPRSFCQRPGMRVWLSRKALRYFGEAVLPQILSRMGEMKVAPKSGEMSGFKYSLTDFLVKHVRVENIDYDFAPGHGLSITVRGITASLVANYSVQGANWYNPVWSHGVLNMPLGSGTEMRATIKMGVSEEGKPQVELERLTTRVELADFYTEHSKATHFAWVMGKLFREDIAEKIADGMRKDMQDNVEVDLASLLDNMNPWVHIPLPLPIQNWGVSVVFCAINIGPEYISTDLHLEFVDRLRPWIAFEGTPDPLPEHPPAMFEARMLAISMTNWAFNSGLYVFGKGGLMNYTMPPEELRDWWYGRANNITIDFWPSVDPPDIEMLDGGISTALTMAFKVRSVDINSGWTVASVDAETPLKMNWNISVEGDSPQVVKVGASFVSASPLRKFYGTIPQFMVTSWTEKACREQVMPQLNRVLSEGFPLPTVSGFSLEKTSFSIVSGSASFFTDMAWDPTEWLKRLNGKEKASKLMRIARHVKRNDR